MKRCALPALLAVLGVNINALATEEDSGLWAAADVSKTVSERVTAAVTLQLRLNDDADRRERTLLRPSLSYRIDPNQTFGGGYDAHFINASKDKVEQRLWQQYQMSRRYAGTNVSLRLRLEQRFIEHIDGVPVRLRVKPALTVPINNSPWSLTISNEFFMAFNSVSGGQRGGFHENRAYLGFGRTLSESIAGQIGYQNQLIERAGRDIMTHQLFIGLAFKSP